MYTYITIGHTSHLQNFKRLPFYLWLILEGFQVFHKNIQHFKVGLFSTWKINSILFKTILLSIKFILVMNDHSFASNIRNVLQYQFYDLRD